MPGHGKKVALAMAISARSVRHDLAASCAISEALKLGSSSIHSRPTLAVLAQALAVYTQGRRSRSATKIREKEHIKYSVPESTNAVVAYLGDQVIDFQMRRSLDALGDRPCSGRREAGFDAFDQVQVVDGFLFAQFHEMGDAGRFGLRNGLGHGVWPDWL